MTKLKHKCTHVINGKRCAQRCCYVWKRGGGFYKVYDYTHTPGCPEYGAPKESTSSSSSSSEEESSDVEMLPDKVITL